MATFEKRGSTTRAQVRMRGQQVQATFDDERDARQWAQRTEDRIRNGETIRKFDETSDPAVAFILERYAREVSPEKASADWEKARVRFYCREFPCFQKRCSEFGTTDVAEFRDKRAKSKNPRGGKLSNSTVIRELGLLSAVFQHAIDEWKMPFDGKRNPVQGVRRPKAPPHRTRRVADDEVTAICAHLGYVDGTVPQTPKQYVAWAFMFSIATAMRKGEILAATWQNVHAAKRYIHLPKTKNGHARDVPLSKRALALLACLDEGKGASPVVPVGYSNFDTIWFDAKTALGLPDLHFHDGRHEGTTQIAGKLSNVLELAAVTGHRSLAMLKIYFNPTATEMASKLD